MTKPVFTVSDKAILKPDSTATRLARKLEFSLVASLDIILSTKGITKVLIRLVGCTGFYKTGFHASSPI